MYGWCTDQRKYETRNEIAGIFRASVGWWPNGCRLTLFESIHSALILSVWVKCVCMWVGILGVHAVKNASHGTSKACKERWSLHRLFSNHELVKADGQSLCYCSEVISAEPCVLIVWNKYIQTPSMRTSILRFSETVFFWSTWQRGISV